MPLLKCKYDHLVSNLIDLEAFQHPYIDMTFIITSIDAMMAKKSPITTPCVYFITGEQFEDDELQIQRILERGDSLTPAFTVLYQSSKIPPQAMSELFPNYVLFINIDEIKPALTQFELFIVRYLCTQLSNENELLSEKVGRLAQQVDSLNLMASHDPLTGLFNRRAFVANLDSALALARRNNFVLSVLYIDLDNFKHVNDTAGHDAGDELLKSVSSIIVDSIRQEDIAGRLGGDEFAVILTKLDKVELSSKIARRICDSFKQQLHDKDKFTNVTPSIGIASYPFAGNTSGEIMKNADAAMYLAKSSGKNTFKYFTEHLSQVG